MKIRIPGLILFCLFVASGNAQVTISPVFPQDTDTITVTFDATQGNGALKDVGPPIVYMHAGVITSASTSATDWRHVQGNWGTQDSKVLMTNLGNNIYQKKYHLRDFYGVPQSEEILRLAFVFRNGDGSVVGRSADGSDIFVDLPKGYALKRLSPGGSNLILKVSDKLNLRYAVSDSSDITIYDNGTSILSLSAALEASMEYTVQSEGQHTIVAQASNGSNQASDTFYFVVNPNRARKDPAEVLPDGCELLNDSTFRFSLYAPGKSFVYLIGDFNNWQLDTSFLMNQTLDGSRFWLDVNGLKIGEKYGYQYYVDGEIRLGDPYSKQVLDPWNDGSIPSSVFPDIPNYPIGKTQGIVTLLNTDTSTFNWTSKGFVPPAVKDLVIYELLVRDFSESHSFQGVIDSLDYLERLGINAIEFMPVSEFEGNESWGYNPSYHMALDKYYGTTDAFKTLVDECHTRGIAVILDVVYNHGFSQSPLCQLYWDNANFRPAPGSPYANITARHPFNVGYDLNHESSATQYWMDRVSKFWIEEYKVDGFRFDLSKGLTQVDYGNDVGRWGQYDASRIALLNRMGSEIRKYKSNAILILEHFADNSEEKVLGENGFLLWGNFNHDYNEASMGYDGNFTWASYKSRGHAQPDVVVYAESHDEERLMYRNINFGSLDGGYDTRSTETALDRMELTVCFVFGIPGPKMLWQFGELGYDVSINFNGRLGNKPIRWNYYQEKGRRDLFNVYSALINLKKQYPAFGTSDYELSVNGKGKSILLRDSEMDVHILGNFNTRLADLTTNFSKTGMWYEYFTGDSLDVTDVKMKLAFGAGEYALYTSKRINNFDDFVSVEEVLSSKDQLLVYPNPNTGLLNIEMPESAIRVAAVVRNSQGQTCITQTFEVGSGNLQIAHELAPGVYTLELQLADNKVRIAKFVVI